MLTAFYPGAHPAGPRRGPAEVQPRAAPGRLGGSAGALRGPHTATTAAEAAQPPQHGGTKSNIKKKIMEVGGLGVVKSRH